jgi:hypothetical protein
MRERGTVFLDFDRKARSMKTTVHILHWVGGIAGLGVLVLGLFIWITGMSPTMLQIVHALFGLTFVLALLTLGMIAVLNRGTRLLGAVSLVYAPLVPVTARLLRANRMASPTHMRRLSARTLAKTCVESVRWREREVSQPFSLKRLSRASSKTYSASP